MMTYRREELGRRMSYIFSCAAFAGAVGGLIGYGLVRIETGSIVGVCPSLLLHSQADQKICFHLNTVYYK
jgi:hypothetical protein